MATIPMCKYCKTRHGLREPHNYPDTKSVTPRGSSVTNDVAEEPTVTRSVSRVTPTVAEREPIVTGYVTADYVPAEAEMIAAAVTENHECPLCGFLHHRPQTTAQRSKAYRERHVT